MRTVTALCPASWLATSSPSSCAGEQRDVAVGDDDRSAELLLGVERVEGVEGGFDGAAGAGHLVLVDDQGGRVDGGDVGGHEVAFMPDDEGQLLRPDGAGGMQRVADEGPAADLVEDFGGTGLHPGTGTCS